MLCRDPRALGVGGDLRKKPKTKFSQIGYSLAETIGMSYFY